MISADETFFLAKVIIFYICDILKCHHIRKWWQQPEWPAPSASGCPDGSAAVWHWDHLSLFIRRQLRMAAHWLSIFLFKKKIPFLKCFQIFYISFPFLSFQPPPFSSPPLWSWRPPCKSTWHHERELNVLERPLLFWWELLCNCKVPIKAQVVS